MIPTYLSTYDIKSLYYDKMIFLCFFVHHLYESNCVVLKINFSFIISQLLTITSCATTDEHLFYCLINLLLPILKNAHRDDKLPTDHTPTANG